MTDPAQQLVRPNSVPSDSDIVAAARRRARVRRVLRRLAVTALVLSSVAWIGTLFWESDVSLEPLAEAVAGGGADDQLDSLLSGESTATADATRPSDVLPQALDGWMVQGVQAVPGGGGSVFEGHFTPQDEERSLVTPLVVYAQVMVGSPEQGESVISRAVAERYDTGVSRRQVNGELVISGYAPDGGSHFIGWTAEEKSFLVVASFKYRIPADGRGPLLRESADAIATAIMDHRPAAGGPQ